MDKEFILSHVKPKMEHDTSFQSFVRELLDSNLLEGDAVKGIGKKIVADGVESLTNKQLDTFVEYGLIKSGNVIDYCVRCSFEIPWSEMYTALDDGYCSYCRHISDKDI